MTYQKSPGELLGALSTLETSDSELATALFDLQSEPPMHRLRDGFKALRDKKDTLSVDGLTLLAGLAWQINQTNIYGLRDEALPVLIEVVPQLPDPDPVDAPPE